MMKNLLLCFLLFNLGCCNSVTNKETKSNPVQKQQIPFDWNNYEINLKPLDIPYSHLVNEIHKAKKTADSISIFFEDALVNQIIPYWYGTPWDFNGHTNIPNRGEIACGYFVSTTLKHLGLNINRYKLAQQLPIHEAKSLSLGNPLIEIKEDNFDNCFHKIETQLKSGIYFIGLNASHVGFLLKRKEEIFFIHSNYTHPQGVVIERAKKSNVLKSFSQFYISELSTNKELMLYWKTGKNIPVITK